MPTEESADAGEDGLINKAKSKNDNVGQDASNDTRGNSAPIQIFLIVALVIIVIYFLSNANTPTATITLPPTYTPRPTYTPYPSNTPLPTYTPLATNTLRPTYTALPTFTPFPTSTPSAIPSSTPTETYTPIPTHTPTQTPIPSRIIIEDIQPMGQLVVVSVEVARADIHVVVEAGRLCDHNADYVAQGVIEAGINFSALDEDNIRFDWATDSYTLQLPAPGLISCRIEYIRQYSNSFSFCNPDWDKVRMIAHYEAIRSFVDRVLEEGLLKRAEDQAEVVLGSFVHSITGKPVNVTYDAKITPPEHPSSCEPDIPRGYSFNDDTNEWVKGD